MVASALETVIAATVAEQYIISDLARDEHAQRAQLTRFYSLCFELGSLLVSYRTLARLCSRAEFGPEDSDKGLG